MNGAWVAGRWRGGGCNRFVVATNCHSTRNPIPQSLRQKEQMKDRETFFKAMVGSKDWAAALSGEEMTGPASR